MNSETRNCQKCKQDFVIDSDDFIFYEKVEVPPPTFCPECRAQRRMSFLNERTLYKRKCDMTGESVVSLFPEGSEVPVYSPKAWWSDAWDAVDYGQEYDFTKPFFEQFGKLLRKVPQFALQNQYTTMIRTEYVNMGTYLKDCYLVFNTAYSEESAYTTFSSVGRSVLIFTTQENRSFATKVHDSISVIESFILRTAQIARIFIFHEALKDVRIVSGAPIFLESHTIFSISLIQKLLILRK